MYWSKLWHYHKDLHVKLPLQTLYLSMSFCSLTVMVVGSSDFSFSYHELKNSSNM